MTTASDLRILVPALLSIAVVAGLGALNLNYPFVADQVIAHLGGRTVAEGGKLYIHFWDNKLPGLFWFHALAGQLFGFTEFGLHCLELIWMLVFSVLLIVALRGWLYVPWLSVFGPIAVVGTYYASADPFHMTQVEALIGLPLLACAWSACRAVQSSI